MTNPTYDFNSTQLMGMETNLEMIERNIKDWIDIGFLKLGHYNNISLDEKYYDDTNLSELTSMDDKIYGTGVCYQSRFKNWVDESGIDYGSYTAPTICSGIYINDVFYDKASTSGDYSFHIDYPNGRVIFDSAISTGNTVKAEFSYKNLEIYEEQRYPEDIYESKYNNSDTEGEDVPNPYRIGLPLVNVIKELSTYEPYGMGGEKKINATYRVDVFSDDKIYGERICDILEAQRDKRIPSINYKEIYPKYDGYGDINSSYSGIINYSENNPWKNIYIVTTKSINKSGIILRGSVYFKIMASIFI